ncbi:hypothetical protein COCNU_01G005900 [Cocos nucifera]|uniref:Uncharacterized protein n=1 Tax=Cocos nucifera TaxID=13894 RepID=A0A8K0HU57_COCNU|nr:hypothetical protein COCNU_01G005900 [Cocos nucifera]
MGGSSSKSAFCSCFSSQHVEAEGELRCNSGKVRPSDEDRPGFVADPNINKKASAFIAKFHESRGNEA